MCKRLREIIKIEKILSVLYGFMMVDIILICMFFSNIEYGRKSLCSNYLPAIIYFIFGIIWCVGIYYCIMIKNKFVNIKTCNIYFFSIALFIFQILAVYSYYFYTDWDVEALMKSASMIVHEGDADSFGWYFSLYPNNMVLESIFVTLIRFIHLLGLHEFEYYGVLVVQCCLNTITGLLLYKVLFELFNDKILSNLGYIIYVLLVGGSPWVSIPYSDSFGLIFPILIIYVYVCCKKSIYFKWICIGILSILGYKIKPQIIIVLFSIIIVNIFFYKKNDIKINLKKYMSFIIGVFLAIIIIKCMVSCVSIEHDKEKVIGMPHFFMMGMNYNSMGVYNSEDVYYSMSIDKKKERNISDFNKGIERIKDLGVRGCLKLFVKKNLTNYNDGTFCWGGEGVFYKEFRNDNKSIMSDFFSELYYSRSFEGKYYVIWSSFMQMIWMSLLLFNFFASFSIKDKNECILMLCIIGITMFELIFEARARYLYIFAPIYIILAVYGFRNMINKVSLNKE